MVKRLARYTEKSPKSSDERNAHGKMKFHEITREFRDNQQYFMQNFIEKIEDDFDTNSALTVLFEYQSYINSGIDEELFSHEEAKSLHDLLESWESVLAIFDFSPFHDQASIPEAITKLAEARILAKNLKDWTEADRLRDEITSA